MTDVIQASFFSSSYKCPSAVPRSSVGRTLLSASAVCSCLVSASSLAVLPGPTLPAHPVSVARQELHFHCSSTSFFIDFVKSYVSCSPWSSAEQETDSEKLVFQMGSGTGVGLDATVNIRGILSPSVHSSPSSLSVAVVKHSDSKQHKGGGRVTWLMRSQSVFEGSRGRNSKGNSKQKVWKDCFLPLLSGSRSQAPGSLAFLYSLGNSTTHSERGSPTSTHSHDSPSQTWLETNLLKTII